MRISSRRTFVLAVAIVLLLWPFAAEPSAGRIRQGTTIVSIAAAQFYGYATPVMVVEKGGELAYANLDIVQHDVVHDVKSDGVALKGKAPWCKRFPRKQCPIFWSGRAGLGDTVEVKGTKHLTSGSTYTFFCTLHPGMKGTLAVAP